LRPLMNYGAVFAGGIVKFGVTHCAPNRLRALRKCRGLVMERAFIAESYRLEHKVLECAREVLNLTQVPNTMEWFYGCAEDVERLHEIMGMPLSEVNLKSIPRDPRFIQISVSRSAWECGQEQAKRLGISMSRYVRQLIHQDAEASAESL